MTSLKCFALLILLAFTSCSIVSCQSKRSASQEADDQVQSLREEYRRNPPERKGYVNNYENLYTDKEEKTLDSLLALFTEKTTIEIAVFTIDTVMTERDSLDAFTLRVANTWGVGQTGKNKGVVIGISRGHKRMRIQNGYGIEKLISDAETKLIVDTAFLPFFRKDLYFEGTRNGLAVLMATLEGRSQPVNS
ncbi:hypothetical protein GCM10023189_55630 [Nibrella saemangeumensis]|uniref:TPM domain-containing protein n=1 Tax=Nibrella saemangeumensis TaxID=1084526 RepID=A0ABP8NPD4_9BACT